MSDTTPDPITEERLAALEAEVALLKTSLRIMIISIQTGIDSLTTMLDRDDAISDADFIVHADQAIEVVADDTASVDRIH